MEKRNVATSVRQSDDGMDMAIKNATDRFSSVSGQVKKAMSSIRRNVDSVMTMMAEKNDEAEDRKLVESGDLKPSSPAQ